MTGDQLGLKWASTSKKPTVYTVIPLRLTARLGSASGAWGWGAPQLALLLPQNFWGSTTAGDWAVSSLDEQADEMSTLSHALCERAGSACGAGVAMECSWAGSCWEE